MEKLKNGINGQIHEKNRFGFRKLSVGLTTVFLEMCIRDRGISELENSWQKSGYKYKLVKALNEDSGCEKFYVLSLPAIQVKRSTIDFEDYTPLGRLFDADVLVKDHNTAISRKDLGQNVRKCFLCSRRAKECARSRRHSVKEMQDFISNLYIKYIENA